jgi:hypothetical protein
MQARNLAENANMNPVNLICAWMSASSPVAADRQIGG